MDNMKLIDEIDAELAAITSGVNRRGHFEIQEVMNRCRQQTRQEIAERRTQQSEQQPKAKGE